MIVFLINVQRCYFSVVCDVLFLNNWQRFFRVTDYFTDLNARDRFTQIGGIIFFVQNKEGEDFAKRDELFRHIFSYHFFSYCIFCYVAFHVYKWFTHLLLNAHMPTYFIYVNLFHLFFYGVKPLFSRHKK